VRLYTIDFIFDKGKSNPWGPRSPT
jgi:hypothetical protein